MHGVKILVSCNGGERLVDVSDRDWPKGDYKLIMFVDAPMWLTTENQYHFAVSNTFTVQKTVCVV